MSLYTYDPQQVSVVFGTTPMRGFAEGTMITVEQEDPHYNSVCDIHGNVTRCKGINKPSKITSTFTQTSSANEIMSNYVELDRVSNAGVFPIIMKDMNGTTFFACTHAWVKQSPALAYGTEAQNREWVIEATGITTYIGSQSK